MGNICKTFVFDFHLIGVCHPFPVLFCREVWLVVSGCKFLFYLVEIFLKMNILSVLKLRMPLLTGP